MLQRCETATTELQDVVDAVERFWDRRGLELNPVPPTAGAAHEWSSILLRKAAEAREEAEKLLAELRRLTQTRFLDEGWWLPLLVAVLLGGALPLGYLVRFEPLLWWPLVAATTLAVTWLARTVARYFLVKSLRQSTGSMQQALADASAHLKRARASSRRETDAALAQLERQKQERTEAAQTDMRERTQRAERVLKEWRTEMETAFQQRCKELEAAWEHETDRLGKHYAPLLRQQRQTLEQDRRTLAGNYERQQQEIEQQFRQDREALQANWSQGLDLFQQFVARTQAACAQHLDWQASDWNNWTAPLSPPTPSDWEPTTCRGRQPRWTTRRPRQPANAPCVLPVLMSFPHHASLVLKARDEGRDAAIRVLHQAMLRLLTSVPAGKIRFTIIDPTGLGQNFSAFMHLADYDERLVGHRIWTEVAHISQRLADLTEHMENVIQKYLRNQFDSIQQYNAKAGEVAEPFRVLVVANYPTHFSEEATRRLISIANSGPRCGVYTLISIDMASRMPRNLQWSDLESNANVLVWEHGGFRWQQEPLAPFRLTLDPPPPDHLMTTAIQAAGRQAQQSSRVEVPFAFVAPEPADRWSCDSSHEISVPLGQAGATHRMALKLGQGTSQHVLIAGKTGSGKSTLLHALITNSALHYGPDQLELYLVDFKKGVEFKPYAEHRLPHAHVIAIESEREFGLSVLQRLDQELRRRGDLYREAGVQSLAQFRQARPQQSMPRTLLIVDEFQEFFVNDDRISHEASLYLDRLVRQGRAFGMHVILGSQTLAGAYSLARSTIGQMAVRIALQCSSSDAHLILSEDNTAARLLGRPGEAIYNDANGLLEGNHPFQVVWLSDQLRSDALRQIADLAASRHCQLPAPIVFEGHTSARLDQNEPLQQRLTLGPTAKSALEPVAWLGSAVAIKDPTSVSLRRQNAQNLLLVGQNEAAARGVLCSCVVSLAADSPPVTDPQRARGVTFCLLDGSLTLPSGDGLGPFLTQHLGLDLTVAGPDDAAEVVEAVAQQVQQRQQEGTATAEPIYLVIYDLARFQALQSETDDFGLPSFGQPDQVASPSSQWATVLRDGPAVGVHTLAWVDNYNNLSRWLQRAQLRDFAYRVLFQMSAVDSSQLMDSTAASQLGGHRAILYQDTSGESEKFRPYGVPDATWLVQVRREDGERVESRE